MSLDHTADMLSQFERRLQAFNEALRASYMEVRLCHQEIEGLWSDAAARTYHSLYDDFDKRLADYLSFQAPRFERFIEERVRLLRHYLHGSSW